MPKHQISNSQAARRYDARIFEDRSFQPHFHRHYELIYIFSGCMEVMIDSRRALLHTGDFALTLSNEVHQYNTVGNCKYWIGVFSADYVPEFHRVVQGKTGSTSSFRCESSILAYLQQYVLTEWQEGVPDYFTLTPGLLLACGQYLRSTQLIDRDNQAYARMNDIADYINANFRSRLTLQDVATALGYDYYYTSRLFRRIFRVSFNDYLNDCRFTYAAQALRCSDGSITDIALDSGFQSIRSFNDVFQKKTGMSPAQYRKSCR